MDANRWFTKPHRGQEVVGGEAKYMLLTRAHLGIPHLKHSYLLEKLWAAQAGHDQSPAVCGRRSQLEMGFQANAENR